MATINDVPEKLIGFRIYKDDSVLMGVGDAELPEIEPMKETVSGSGIAGEFESPVIGHTGSLVAKLKFRTLTKDASALAAFAAHQLTFRGSIQVLDSSTGNFAPVGLKVVTKSLPLKFNLGKLETGKMMDTAQEFECVYLKVVLDNEAVLEIDKLACLYKVGDDDVLAKVREHLGMEV